MVRLRDAFLFLALAAAAAPAPATALVAPPGPAVPGASPVLSPREQAVRTLLEQGEIGGVSIERAILDGMRAFYQSHRYELAWLPQRQASPQMVALRRQMDMAAEYGLDAGRYGTPYFARMYLDDPHLLAEADVGFSVALARFVAHIAAGAGRPSDVSRLITLEPELPDIADALLRLAQAGAPDTLLSGYEPVHAQYHALKEKLAELRASDADDARIFVPDGSLLRPGKSDPRVPLLRERLGAALAPDADPEHYDDVLRAAVEAFQAESGLTVDGIVGPRTLIALNGVSREDQIAAIIANMERWRWMPRDLGKVHVFVNVPEFMLRVVKDGAVAHETRIIVGTPRNPTPTFSHGIDHIVVNPFWNVPTSIVSNEMLPEIRRNPYGYFAQRGYQVLARAGGRMRVVNPASIDWYMVNPRSVRIRQVPGDHNALGRIKFMFPNQHSVYLHDTPTKSLFKRDRRAFSHGCVRVENPLGFADAILPIAAPEWNSDRLQRLYGGPERRVNLDTPVPVHLAYFTVSVTPDGDIRHVEDLYGYDRKMSEMLGF